MLKLPLNLLIYFMAISWGYPFKTFCRAYFSGVEIHISQLDSAQKLAPVAIPWFMLQRKLGFSFTFKRYSFRKVNFTTWTIPLSQQKVYSLPWISVPKLTIHEIFIFSANLCKRNFWYKEEKSKSVPQLIEVVWWRAICSYCIFPPRPSRDLLFPTHVEHM